MDFSELLHTYDKEITISCSKQVPAAVVTAASIVAPAPAQHVDRIATDMSGPRAGAGKQAIHTGSLHGSICQSEE